MENTPEPIIEFDGLTSAQVVESKNKYGCNIITPPPKTSPFKLFFQKLDDPIIKVLIAATIISFGVGLFDGHYVESIGIFTAILLATVISFINEYKAKKEFDLLNLTRDDEPVAVIRDGKYSSINKKEIVVGDFVIIEVGDEIPADGIILKSVSLQVNESSLTGENLPVSKYSQLESQKHNKKKSTYEPYEVKRGTFVSDGNGIIKITEVGDNTDIGKTARAASEETGRKTPLTKQLEKLSKVIGSIGFTFALLTFVVLFVRALLSKELELTPTNTHTLSVFALTAIILSIKVWMNFIYDIFELLKLNFKKPKFLITRQRGQAWIIFFMGMFFLAGGMYSGIRWGGIPSYALQWLTPDIIEKVLSYFMISVTLIVVAIPEGLAMAVTLSLAYSVRKMTKLNNLVRKMHAVETISAATVICSDKTGTLTRNEMRVKDCNFPILDKGINKSQDREKIDFLIFEGVAANSSANLTDDKTKLNRVLGNPTEGALLIWLEEQEVNYRKIRDDFKIRYQWTFNTERKYMATYGNSLYTGKPILHIKGAPEIILEKCSKLMLPSGLEDIEQYKTDIKELLENNQQKALRTIALAVAFEPAIISEKALEESECQFIWLGLFSIQDPVRKEVPNAILECKKAGIEVKIVTGDTYITAREVGKQINLFSDETQSDCCIVLGNDFRDMDDEEAFEKAQKLKILARAKPMDKLRLVKLLQKANEVVAVTGDGINDAPALNYADVGLAMGKTGTSVAKEASDIILLDDSFTSIVNAVLFGRSLYLNIQRFLLFQLIINILALSIVFFGPFIGVALTLTVTQMIWVNLIMDTFAALALATQPPDHQVMNRPPRKSNEFILTPLMIKEMFIYAFIFFIVLVSFLIYFQSDGSVSIKESTYFFNIFVFLQFWNLFNVRVFGTNHNIFYHLTQKNKPFVFIIITIAVLQFLIVQYGGIIFRTVPLTFWEWIQIFLGTSLVLLLKIVTDKFLKVKM